MRKWLMAVLVLGAAAFYYFRPVALPALLTPATPHERYLRGLERAGLGNTALASDWKSAAERALADPAPASLPAEGTLTFPDAQAQAVGYRVALRRGRVLRVEASAAGQPARVFIDLFRLESGKPPRPVASAADHATLLEHEITADGDYVVRIQPELLRAITIRVSETTRAALTFPVSERDSTAVRSFFHDPRDAGRREHHGVDIFAPRGTPVLAAAGGVVTGVTTTELGGKVVWVWDARRRHAQYYAHLSEQAVSTGALVAAGDVVGYVGNTGNASTTPPHLHFGIYSVGEGAIDPLPFVQGARGPAVTPRGEPARSRGTQAPAASDSAGSEDR